MTRREHNVRMIIQRLTGILMLFLTYVGYQQCVTAVEREDAGGLIVLAILGIYLLVTRKLVFR